jgi:hypothetical protein
MLQAPKRLGRASGSTSGAGTSQPVSVGKVPSADMTRPDVQLPPRTPQPDMPHQALGNLLTLRAGDRRIASANAKLAIRVGRLQVTNCFQTSGKFATFLQSGFWESQIRAMFIGIAVTTRWLATSGGFHRPDSAGSYSVFPRSRNCHCTGRTGSMSTRGTRKPSAMRFIKGTTLVLGFAIGTTGALAQAPPGLRGKTIL